MGKTSAQQERPTTTSEDLDDDLPLLRLLHLDIDHFEGLALFLLLKGLVSLGKRHCGSDFWNYGFVVRELRMDRVALSSDMLRFGFQCR